MQRRQHLPEALAVRGARVRSSVRRGASRFATRGWCRSRARRRPRRRRGRTTPVARALDCS
eukprot:1471960-Pyramimonas_sp.AAC.1